MMVDRPILFSGPMVRAILDGSKTQTRRPMKAPPTVPFSTVCRDAAGIYTGDEWGHELERLRVPHAPGDQLWVRETFWQACRYPCTLPSGEPEPHEWTRSDQIHYAANGRPLSHPNESYPEGLSGKRISAPAPYATWEQRPSIHMPRWASRLTLIVTDVRVQRLQDISATDAIAEGIADGWSDGMHGYLIYEQGQRGEIPYLRYTGSPVASYASLWDACYGSSAWDANPWVVATTFTTHHCNIDKMGAQK